MKNRLVQLAIASTLVLLIATLVCWQLFGNATLPVSDHSVAAESVPSIPPPPKVNEPARVRESLKPGKTYVSNAKGTVAFRGTDKAWGIQYVITINYGFESQIERAIESNDGRTIVEVRHFRDIRSVKLEGALEDLRIDLGNEFDGFLLGLQVFNPKAAGVMQLLQGVDRKQVFNALRWIGVSPEKLVGLDEKLKAFAQVDRLTGKSVRLTYVDGAGVVNIENVTGTLTSKEEAFVRTSVLVADSLIFPNEKVKPGERWTVSGRTLGDMIDPGLRAKTGGEFIVQRAPDETVKGRNCAQLKIVAGRIQFDDSNPGEGHVGHFDPEGKLDFSLEDKIVIYGKARGSAVFEQFSKNHLLFETRSSQNPVLDLVYTCVVIDTPK
jgi:hypothetical protein